MQLDHLSIITSEQRVATIEMKPGQGKNKGSQFEREVGYKLSLWLSKGERKDLLCRTVGSGAQFTAWNSGHPGDLRSQHPVAETLCNKFVIEVKFWKDLKILQFLSGKGELHEAMLKVQDEAKKLNKKWWLIAKQNHQKELLICADIYTNLDLQYHSLFSGKVTVYFLEDFLKVQPEKFLRHDCLSNS